MKKKNKNKVLLNQFVDLSYAMRRRDIMSNTYDLESIYSKYPFLKEDTEQVYKKCFLGLIFTCTCAFVLVFIRNGKNLWKPTTLPCCKGHLD